MFRIVPITVAGTLHPSCRVCQAQLLGRATVPFGHMDERSRDAVARLVSHARAKAGSGAKLAQMIEQWYGQNDKPSLSTVNAWANGSNPAPGWVLFALARVYGLSLDEFAFSEEDRRTLADQLAELRQDVQALQIHVARLLEQEDDEAVEEA